VQFVVAGSSLLRHGRNRQRVDVLRQCHRVKGVVANAEVAPATSVIAKAATAAANACRIRVALIFLISLEQRLLSLE
jgi:hypothetical protein